MMIQCLEEWRVTCWKTETGDSSWKLFVARLDILSVGVLTLRYYNKNTKHKKSYTFLFVLACY